jgi:hypothetical protein
MSTVSVLFVLEGLQILFQKTHTVAGGDPGLEFSEEEL